jgi:hypothetical protein
VYEDGGTRLGGEAMRVLRKLRFSMGTIMMFVLMAATSLALFVKIRQHTDDALPAGWRSDIPSLFLLAIVLTARHHHMPCDPRIESDRGHRDVIRG